MAQKNFFTTLRNIYRKEVIDSYKRYASDNRKLTNMISRKNFLIQCRKHNVFPAHIGNICNNIYKLIEAETFLMNKLHNITNNYKKQILNLEINVTFQRIKTIQNNLDKLNNFITQKSSTIFYSIFFDLQSDYRESLRVLNERKFVKKLNRLYDKHRSSNHTARIDVINLTETIIPPDINLILGYGTKFAMHINKMNTSQLFKLISDIESILNTLQDVQLKNNIRSELVNIITNYMNSPARTPSVIQKHLVHCFQLAKQFFKINNNLVVLQADKGNKTVVMDKNEYHVKMLALLDDTNTYRLLNKNPTTTIQRANNKLVADWYKMGYITLKEKTVITTYTGATPRMYGLPKIHKPNIPLRPIVSNTNSPTYQLAKFYAQIIHNSIDHEKYNIHSSFSFQQFITEQLIPPQHIVVSLDVISLFTSIPINLITANIDQRWSRISSHTTLPLHCFKEGLALLLERTFFVYDGKYYIQLDGTPMGSCLSPAVADLVLDVLLDQVILKLPFKPLFIKKYVDDLITIIPSDKIDEILSIFNDYSPNIQFTIETEMGGKLPFLDMMLTHNQVDGSITTSWYQKPTASGRMLNYLSAHKYSQKIGTASGYIHRVISLTSNITMNTHEIIRRQLLLNNYPSALINKLINKHIHNTHTKTSTLDTGQLHNQDALLKSYGSITFIDDLTHKLAKVLKSNLPSTTLGFKCPNTLSGLYTKLKDSISPLQRSNIVYSIPCTSCDKVYIGLTRQLLKSRVSNHVSDRNRLTKLQSEIAHLNDSQQAKELEVMLNGTALIRHVINLDHEFSYDKTTIVCSDNNYTKLKMLEMLYIQHLNTVNLRSDVEGLSSVYSGLLHKAKQS